MALLFLTDDAKDAALDHVKDNADREVMCEGKPATYAEADDLKGAGGKALGSDTPTFTGPASGDVSGRKLTVNALLGVDNDVTGVLDYVALVDDDADELLLAYPAEHADIKAVNTGDDIVTIEGDRTSKIGVDDYVTIRTSTGNDGIYTVSAVSESGGDTLVTLNEDVSHATADGVMIFGAQYIASGSTTDLSAFDTEIRAAEPQ